MNTLMVGGTSGLGLELARAYAGRGDKVIVAGRGVPNEKFADFYEFDLTTPNLSAAVDEFIDKLPDIDSLVYVAGLYPAGRVTELAPEQIEAALSVAGRGLIYFARSLLLKQGKLDEVITVTSMAQFNPAEKEVVYNFVKAGAGHFSNGLAKDERVGKVLVVAPSAMKNADEPGDALARDWVARQIIKASDEDYEFKLVKILRRPARVEVVEKR